ncbi:inositol monophosphatase family protein [Desulfovibrio inopinatus]|uniref:inositol monophosphatase family protein n=1 Tax=Desulfovibrio inopinatus TaxID=102109 RepID=UPI0003FE3AB4|nr:inositol monophosphatase family protein [Desulfovibrio inopinatus]
MQSPTSPEAFSRIVDTVVSCSDIMRLHWDKPRNIKRKGRIDLVTETDLAVETALKEALSQLYPESSFLAEETASDAALSDMTWVIDPVDGTTNFAHGIPMCCTSVGLWNQGELVLGVISAPMLHEVFAAAKGRGATLNGRPIAVSTTSELEDAVVATGFPYAIRENIDPVMDNLKRTLTAAQGVRRVGSAAIDLAYTACGRFDAFYEVNLKPWDMAAGVLILTEAGGRVSTYNPNEAHSLYSSSLLVSNGLIHDRLGALLT